MNVFQDISKGKILSYIVAFLIILTFQPYFIWHSTFSITGLSTLLVAVYLFSKTGKKIYVGYTICFTLLYLYLSIYGGYTFFGSIINLCVLACILSREQVVGDVFDAFRQLYAILITLSLIVFVLVVFLGVSLPYKILEPINTGKINEYYEAYPFLVNYYSHGILLPRFCGLFDEPGVVGTISGSILVAKNYDLKDRYNIPILVAGLLSASLFFILISIAYILLFSKGRYRIFFIIVFFLFVIYLSSNELMQELFINRISFTDGKLSGDNRQLGISASWYESFKQSGSYWFGLGNHASSRYNAGGSSYVDLIIDYGLVFLVTYTLSFIFLTYKKLRNFPKTIKILLIYCGIIYQRPYIECFGYAFLYFAPIALLFTEINNRSCVTHIRSTTHNSYKS